MAWADSHCHLHDPKVADGMPLVEVMAAGVRRVITVGTDRPTSMEAVITAADAAIRTGGEVEVWATAGLHPHDAKDGWEWLDELLAGAPANRIVAVGEAGLDYYYEHSPREQQRHAFAAQIGLAHAYGLPLVIHTRDAWDDTFAVLASEGVPARTVFHCFTGGPAEAERCLALDAFLSYSGIVTFKTADELRAAVACTPLNRILVETDAPYLAPVPHRGKRNHPAWVPIVGAAVAAVLGLDVATVEAATWSNTAEAFRLYEAEEAVRVRSAGTVGGWDGDPLPRDTADALERHGLTPSRALGQNFVVDPNTVRRIARLSEVGPGDRVLEIGPGLGALSLALLETGASLTVVEIDRHLIPPLHEVLDGTGAAIVHGDAMRLDWDVVLGPSPQSPPWVLVANLPYNVATPLVADVLDLVPQVGRMLVMVQKEVGERLAARPRTPAYGAVSVKVAYWATATVVGTVPPTVFLPQPNVDSALVRIDRRAAPAIDPAAVSADALFALVRAGFAQRRKMLRRSLGALVTPETFAAAAVAPEARPEELTVEDWGRLAIARAAVLPPAATVTAVPGADTVGG